MDLRSTQKPLRSQYRSFFFFSSRRRHTRYWRDWSSDVCSSDLFTTVAGLTYDSGNYEAATARARELFDYDGLRAEQARRRASNDPVQLGIGISRSEERRVGKECRSRWSPYH